MHKLHDDDDDSEDENDKDFYEDKHLFDPNLQFRFSNQGPEYDDGDDFQDHYQEEDDYGEDQDDSGNVPGDERVKCTMFVKAGIDSDQGNGTSMKSCGVPQTIKMDGDLRTKIVTKGTKPLKSGVPKPIYTNGGLRPGKSDDSNAQGIKWDRKPNLVSKSNS